MLLIIIKSIYSIYKATDKCKHDYYANFSGLAYLRDTIRTGHRRFYVGVADRGSGIDAVVPVHLSD